MHWKLVVPHLAPCLKVLGVLVVGLVGFVEFNVGLFHPFLDVCFVCLSDLILLRENRHGVLQFTPPPPPPPLPDTYFSFSRFWAKWFGIPSSLGVPSTPWDISPIQAGSCLHGGSSTCCMMCSHRLTLHSSRAPGLYSTVWQLVPVHHSKEGRLFCS